MPSKKQIKKLKFIKQMHLTVFIYLYNCIHFITLKLLTFSQSSYHYFSNDENQIS